MPIKRIMIKRPVVKGPKRVLNMPTLRRPQPSGASARQRRKRTSSKGGALAVQARPKSLPATKEKERIAKDKPWDKYRKEAQHRLLIPGWPGVLDDSELSYVQERLKADPVLSFAWGFQPGQKTRSDAAIRGSACTATGIAKPPISS
jgi:hypothetical protein